ncbi:MAG: hypothetical protein R6V23_03235 [Bacteroidales bacterium]
MNREQIKVLLEKYYKGESSLEEEKLLRNYFAGSQVDDELLDHKDIFVFSENEFKASDDIPDLSNEIWNNIEKINSVKQLKKRKLYHYSLSIAASIAILVVSFFFIQDEINQGSPVQFEDTYDNPELAYLQAKEALLFVSSKLNSGTDHLKPIEKINEGAQELEILSTFNKGLKELKPVQKFDVADKYIKQK